MQIKKISIIAILLGMMFMPSMVFAQDVTSTPAERNCGFLCRIQRIFIRNREDNTEKRQPNLEATPGIQKLGLEKRIQQAVTNGKMTQEQATELQTRLSAIKTKQQELRDLEKSLAEWMKTNNLPLTLIPKPNPNGPRNETEGLQENEPSTTQTVDE